MSVLMQITPSSGLWWDRLTRAIQEGLVPHDSHGQPINVTLAVAPGMLSGRTDSAKFAALSDHGIYRFVPLSLNLTAGDVGLLHGIGERLHTNTFFAAIRFYAHAFRALTTEAS